MPLTIATFNVKNLLPEVDERRQAILRAKLDLLAQTLRACDADLVGLQEIGPSELVRQLGDRLAGVYGEPVLGTADARGIRCAVMSRLPLRSVSVHTAPALSFPVFVSGDPPPFGGRIPLRRGVVHARIDGAGMGAVDVMVVHFKSPRPVLLRDASGLEVEPVTACERAEGLLRSLAWRSAEALHVRALVDTVLSGDPGARVALVGDMNDVPDSVVLRILRSEGPGALFDCASRAAAEARFTLLHDGRRLQLDHVLATANLDIRVQTVRFLNGELREHATVAPGVEPSQEEDPTVDSDHAPLVVRFE